MTARSTRLEFRNLLQPGAAAVLPGVANALAARVVADLGFPAAYVTGAGIANTYLGIPDNGLVTLSELCDHVAAIRDVFPGPIMVDADTGFGNALNMTRTVKMLERAGADAIQIEDQVFPKRCGHFDGKETIPKSEMVAKVKAAADARTDLDTHHRRAHRRDRDRRFRGRARPRRSLSRSRRGCGLHRGAADRAADRHDRQARRGRRSSTSCSAAARRKCPTTRSSSWASPACSTPMSRCRPRSAACSSRLERCATRARSAMRRCWQSISASASGWSASRNGMRSRKSTKFSTSAKHMLLRWRWQFEFIPFYSGGVAGPAGVPADRIVMSPKFSLPVRLGVLVAGTLLPLIVFAGVIVYQNHIERREEAFARVLQLVRSTRLILDSEVKAMTAGLQVLALSAALQRDDFEQFRRNAESFLTQFPENQSIVVGDRDGRQVFDTRIAPAAAAAGAHGPRRDRRGVQDAATGLFAAVRRIDLQGSDHHDHRAGVPQRRSRLRPLVQSVARRIPADHRTPAPERGLDVLVFRSERRQLRAGSESGENHRTKRVADAVRRDVQGAGSQGPDGVARRRAAAHRVRALRRYRLDGRCRHRGRRH